MRRSLVLPGLWLIAVSCGDSTPPTSGNRVAEVMILLENDEADTVYRADFLGGLDLRAIALNSRREELPGNTYVISWSSSDGSIAAVAGGHVTASKNGSVWIIARSADFADSIRIAIVQTARQVRLRQDTVVALTPGATKISGNAVDVTVQRPDTLRFEAYITDRAGTPATSDVSIGYTNLDPSVFTIIPNPRGDTVKIIGIAPGSGGVALSFLDFRDTVAVQVVSSYALVQINQGLGATIVTPSNVTVPAGAAVLFQNGLDGGSFLVLGSGWRVGPIPSRLREANVFSRAGSFSYTVGSATATVTVTP